MTRSPKSIDRIKERSSPARAGSPKVRPHATWIIGEQASDSQFCEVVGKAARLMVVDRVDKNGNLPRFQLCDRIAPQGLGRAPLAITDRLGPKALCRQVKGLRSGNLSEICVRTE